MRTHLVLAAPLLFLLLSLAATAHAQNCRDLRAFGVVADACTANGGWSPHPTNTRDALQRAIDACAGRTLVVPAGNYYVRASGGGAALAITHAMSFQMEPGATIYFDLDERTDALLVEPGPPYPLVRTDLRVNLRAWRTVQSGRHGLVAHALVDVHDSFVADFRGWCVLVESGTSGASEGASRLPSGTYFGANFAVVERTTVGDCGDQTYSGDMTKGGGVRVHGSDANGARVESCFATYVNVGFQDGSLEGVTWLRDYVEVGGPAGHAVGYEDDSSNGARYYDCREELAHPSTLADASRVVGGGLARGRPQAAVDADLYSIARPLRSTHDRWTWRQRVTLRPGVQVVRTGPRWSASASIMRGDARVPSDSVRIDVGIELPTTNDWNVRMPMVAADRQVDARAAQLLALDVECGPVARGYQDAGGGLFLVRCESRARRPVDVDLVWSMEVFERSLPNTAGP